MKLLLTLLLIPTLSLANWISGEQSPAYSQKSLCEKTEQAPCYFVEPGKRAIQSIKDVEVDDHDKPIFESVAPVEICEEIEGDRISVACRLACEAPYELEDGECITVIGYGKKLERRMVVDEAKVQAKEAEELQKTERLNACEAYKTAIRGMTLSDKPDQAAQGVALRNILGKMKHCGI